MRMRQVLYEVVKDSRPPEAGKANAAASEAEPR